MNNNECEKIFVSRRIHTYIYICFFLLRFSSNKQDFYTLFIILFIQIQIQIQIIFITRNMDHDFKVLELTLQNIDESLSKYHVTQNNVVLLGMKNIGKTILALKMCREPLKILKMHGKYVCQPTQQSKLKYIGHSPNPCTTSINCFSIQQNNIYTNIFDPPGFTPSLNVKQRYLQFYTMFQLYSRISSVKFVLVINTECLGSIAKFFKILLKQFIDYFQFDEHFTQDKVFQSTILFITKSRISKSDVIKKIDAIYRVTFGNNLHIQDKQMKILQKLMKRFTDENNICIGKCVEQNSKSVEFDDVLKKLEQVHYLTGLKLHNLNFSKEFNEIKNFLDTRQLIEHYPGYFTKILQILTRNMLSQDNSIIFQAINEDLKIKLQNSANFLSVQTKQFVEQVHTKKYFKYYYLLKSIFTLSKKPKTQKFKLIQKQSILEYNQQLLQPYLTMINQLRCIKLLDHISLFLTSLERKLKQNIVIDYIDTKNKRQICRSLQNYLAGFQSDFPDAIPDQIIAYEIKQDESELYYEQLAEILDQFRDKDWGILKIWNNKYEKYRMLSKKISQKDSLLNFIQLIQFQEKFIPQIPQVKYKKIYLKQYQYIANILYKFDYYDQSLEIYKQLDNTKQILECYQQLLQQQNVDDNKVRIYRQRGRYLCSILSFEEGLLNIKLASDFCQDFDLKQQLKKQMVYITKNKQRFIEQFQQQSNINLANKKFKFIFSFAFEDIISKIQKRQSQQSLQSNKEQPWIMRTK